MVTDTHTCPRFWFHRGMGRGGGCPLFKRLVAMEVGVEVVVAVLMAGSEKAKERGFEYAIRTVKRAMK